MIRKGAELASVNPNSPTPHKDKLRKLASNPKLPEADRERVALALRKYDAWVKGMDSLDLKGDARVVALVETLNEYLNLVKLDLIWDSEADFIFRQQGQLKLSSTVLEEFLPRLADPGIVPALQGRTYSRGPRKTFAGAQLAATLFNSPLAASLSVRTKDQDFTVGRDIFLRSSFDRSSVEQAGIAQQAYMAFVAAECKTNLDKTMFQEATATARDLKRAVPGSRYYLLCEWLDMKPISSLPTDIDEVLILRHKRPSAGDRKDLSSSNARKARREEYARFLEQRPVRTSSIMRFVEHLRSFFKALEAQGKQDVIERGYF